MQTLINGGKIRPAAVGATGATFGGSVRLEGVSKNFGDIQALENVTLDIKPRETICLLGQSGCGKTTLLRIAAGIETATSGRIELDSVELVGPSTFVPPEKRNIGLVFQDYALFPHMTILENVMFGLTELKRKDAKVAARQVLMRVSMGKYADAYPHMLSGGQQQRVALARALAPRPQVLLLDEPFSGLDSVLRDQVRTETLAILRQTAATSIIVTHDPEEALYMGDRVALMRDGRIEQVGTPEELYQNPKNGFVAGFFGGLNRFESVVEGGEVATPLGTFAAPGFGNGAKVDVMVRTEGVDIQDANDGDRKAHGRVLTRKFAGDTSWVSVVVEGGGAPLKLKIKARKKLKSDLVSFVVDPSSVLIFTTTTK